MADLTVNSLPSSGCQSRSVIGQKYNQDEVSLFSILFLSHLISGTLLPTSLLSVRLFRFFLISYSVSLLIKSFPYVSLRSLVLSFFTLRCPNLRLLPYLLSLSSDNTSLSFDSILSMFRFSVSAYAYFLSSDTHLFILFYFNL